MHQAGKMLSQMRGLGCSLLLGGQGLDGPSGTGGHICWSCPALSLLSTTASALSVGCKPLPHATSPNLHPAARWEQALGTVAKGNIV